MFQKIMMKLKAASTKLFPPMNICKKCCKDFSINNFPSLFIKENVFCYDCLSELKMKYIKFKSNGVDCLALYEYDETIKTLIFQLKGCFDIELRHIFIVRSLPFLNIKYRNYVKVPIPSSKEDDLNRGFNHVEEMFSLLKLQEQKVLVKTMNYKQSDHSKEDRGNIKNILAIYNNVSLKDKKVLIVDDIYTTGSTINAAIDLVKKSGAKTIKVLVIAKTILKTIES